MCSPLKMLPSVMFSFIILSLYIYRPHKCWAEIPGRICGFRYRPNCVHCRKNRGSVATLEHPSLSSGPVVALSRQLLMLISKSVCRDKFVKRHNIYATPMSLAFVVSLSGQCDLTFFFDDCRDKDVQCRNKLSFPSSLFVSRMSRQSSIYSIS